MTSEQKQRYLQDMKRQRGYVLDFHRIMVAADLDWVKAYDPFAAATYTSQRGLDRKTKELLQTVVLAALRSDVDHIKTHIDLAIQEGATAEEVLEALEAVVLPMGMLGFRAGLLAWAAATGTEPVEDIV
jgi:4-carboxymuconolactone decarboxylase|tara:strand:- start:68 stop:454 length:387 start_codon:yes stop_codon:yes gene_type:complete